MAVIPEQVVETVEEIMMTYKSLPPRPTIEEVEAAMSVIKTVNTEEQLKLEEISKQEPPKNVPQDLFVVLQEVRKTVVLFHSYEQRREAVHVVEVDSKFQIFDDLIQRASGLVSGDTQMKKPAKFSEPVEKPAKILRDAVISDASLVTTATATAKKKNREVEMKSEKIVPLGLERSSSAKASFYAGNSEKFSLMKVAALIENTAKSGSQVLDLKGKLTDQIEGLPVSIGKLSEVTELDLSENRIVALPPSICRLRALTKLDIHSNQLVNLPDSFGDLINLTDLDLHANRLRSLPDTFGNLKKLINLDLSSNELTHLPELLGNLTSLKCLTVETNELEELPYSIGSCTMLTELRLDFNQLRALPEAVGKLESLEVLTLHYNRIKGLPTTIGNLMNLKELDLSFNELESVPENLCFATGLRKLNVGKNFADLRALPRSIGNLEMLEELDISDNQIRYLPDSFRFLSKLRLFRADETPLEIPPRHVIKLGAQAVVQFMEDYVAKRDTKTMPLKKQGSWFLCCIKPQTE
ncbi:hypothetical protein CsatB_004504 [Cannabis sativa]|uniref:Uncharacterized protein n=2 Tax=Cannabis sativa TaxID=3483 RepID=A0AB40EAN8_CANSA|nr:plant intracellular Ras-group-related LRR protein 5 [Cannabis sativa]KAF4354907.1 hypothetical protein F8388_013856 [Cannabis sativa]KAF4358027.1 hypothetical protein F8388_008535 [Cannabis sativa]KAF4404342.1 hypothetical protein G4B88_014798 [Cannabis sativa]